MRRWIRSLALAGPLALVAALGLPGSAQAAGLPELVFEAPEELAPVRARLEALEEEDYRGGLDLTGYAMLPEPGPPIRVILAAEDSPLAQAPPWVSGYAHGNLGVVVLLVERVPRYPSGSLEELLRHEVAHVLVARAAAGRPVPRWFNEGLATVAGGRWGLEDGLRLSAALIRGYRPRLANIEAYFQGSESAVTYAYAVSASFFRHLERRYGPGVAASILRRVARGDAFEDAFEDVTGVSLAAAEKAFADRETFWYRWMPLISSSTLLWIGISALAVLAAARRRRRERRPGRRKRPRPWPGCWKGTTTRWCISGRRPGGPLRSLVGSLAGLPASPGALGPGAGALRRARRRHPRRPPLPGAHPGRAAQPRPRFGAPSGAGRQGRGAERLAASGGASPGSPGALPCGPPAGVVGGGPELSRPAIRGAQGRCGPGAFRRRLPAPGRSRPRSQGTRGPGPRSPDLPLAGQHQPGAGALR